MRGWADIRVRGSPVNHEGEGDQHERERDLQRGPETGVALPLEPVAAMPKITSTEQVRICAPTKPAPKPNAFSRPDGITASVAATVRGEARQETIQDYLNRGVEHPGGHVMPAEGKPTTMTHGVES